jgi:hypothetical protein
LISSLVPRSVHVSDVVPSAFGRAFSAPDAGAASATPPLVESGARRSAATTRAATREVGARTAPG